MKQLIRKAQEAGWSVKVRRNSHYKITNPEGESYYCGSTPSDVRAVKNVRAALRRMGLDT